MGLPGALQGFGQRRAREPPLPRARHGLAVLVFQHGQIETQRQRVLVLPRQDLVEVERRDVTQARCAEGVQRHANIGARARRRIGPSGFRRQRLQPAVHRRLFATLQHVEERVDASTRTVEPAERTPGRERDGEPRELCAQGDGMGRQRSRDDPDPLGSRAAVEQGPDRFRDAASLGFSSRRFEEDHARRGQRRTRPPFGVGHDFQLPAEALAEDPSQIGPRGICWIRRLVQQHPRPAAPDQRLQQLRRHAGCVREAVHQELAGPEGLRAVAGHGVAGAAQQRGAQPEAERLRGAQAAAGYAHQGTRARDLVGRGGRAGQRLLGGVDVRGLEACIEQIPHRPERCAEAVFQRAELAREDGLARRLLSHQDRKQQISRAVRAGRSGRGCRGPGPGA